MVRSGGAGELAAELRRRGLDDGRGVVVLVAGQLGPADDVSVHLVRPVGVTVASSTITGSSSRPSSSPSTANSWVVQVPALRRLQAVTADRISALGLPWSG